MGQGQPRVIIWTTLVVLPYTMLHTKFQGHRSSGSGEEDFLRFLPYMGMAAMLVMWPRPFEQFFFPKGPGGCIWNLVAICPVVSEEKSFEIVDGRRTDGRTTEPSHPISSLGAFGSGELKIKVQLMLYTKFKSNISSDSWGKVDFSGLAIFSNSGHIWFPSSLNFIFLKPCSLVMLHVRFENHGCSDFRE